MPAEWTAHILRSWLDSLYGLEPVIVLANRGPYRQSRSGRGPFARGSGGLVTALEPLMQACNGVWVAHGTGSTERIVLDGRAGLKVPPAISGFRLRNVSLSAHEEQGYYYGFSNEGLWPLCAIRRRGLRRSRHGFACRVRTGLSLCAGAAHDSDAGATRTHCGLLAHPVSKPTRVGDVSLGAAAARGPPWQFDCWISNA